MLIVRSRRARSSVELEVKIGILNGSSFYNHNPYFQSPDFIFCCQS